MATKISFFNLKGGVGKTSLAVNVAACLAYMGKRVLIVDFDAQSNASIWLMRLDRWNELNRRPEAFLLSVFKDPARPLADCVRKSPVKSLRGEDVLPSLDLVPANFALMDLEHEIENATGGPWHQAFWKQLQTIEGDYDFVFFDCPPSFFYATQCALYASDRVLVPANPDALSIIGFHLLMDKLVKFKAATRESRAATGAPAAEILGIVLNAVKQGARIDTPLERFQAQLDRLAGQGAVPEEAAIFPTRIRNSITVGRAVMQGLPTVLMSKAEGSMAVAEDYIATAQAILDRAPRAPAAKEAEPPREPEPPRAAAANAPAAETPAEVAPDKETDAASIDEIPADPAPTEPATNPGATPEAATEAEAEAAPRLEAEEESADLASQFLAEEPFEEDESSLLQEDPAAEPTEEAAAPDSGEPEPRPPQPEPSPPDKA